MYMYPWCIPTSLRYYTRYYSQPYCERLQAFAVAGFSLAAGVPFDIRGYRGIVVFFGNPHLDPSKLRHRINSRFINYASQLIGAAAAIAEPLEEVQELNRKNAADNWRRLKIKLLLIVRLGGALQRRKRESMIMMTKHGPGGTDDDEQLSAVRRCGRRCLERCALLRKDFSGTGEKCKMWLLGRGKRWHWKVRGGHTSMPPPCSTTQSMFTFFGVLATSAILSKFNHAVMERTDGELQLMLPTISSLLASQFNLTAAPASQPRNAFLSQVFAISMAILMSYIPCEPWFRSSLSSAVIAAGMAK